MHQFSGQVAGVETLGPALHIIWLVAPELLAMGSGQFVLARCSDSFDPLLRRGLSLHQRRADGAHGFLFGTSKAWGRWLAARRPGDHVDLIGPLGRGFRREPTAHRLLMIAEGLGIAPLVALAEEAVAAGCAVTLLQDAPTASRLYPRQRLPEAVRVVSYTADGSAGRPGRVLDGLAEWQEAADQLFVAGSARLLADLRVRLAPVAARLPVQVMVEERMACGVGACLGCVVFTVEGPVASCVEGPVFDLWRLTG